MAVMNKNANRRRIKRETSQNNLLDKPWERMIALIDMNAFFASVEKLDFPKLRDVPVGVTNGLMGTTIITSCYLAREKGIRLGTKVYDAKRIDPNFVQRASRPERYAQISRNIMKALQKVTPDVEIFSVDEAFLDLTHCQRLYGSPENVIKKIKEVMREATNGLPFSIGLAGDKTTAKFAAKRGGMHSIAIIHPDDAETALANAPVTAICGINRGIARHLQARGVTTCGQMKNIPISEMRRWGNQGRRLWLACQGKDPMKVANDISDPKSLGHGKVLPPNTSDETTLQIFMSHMAHKVAARLRKNKLKAKTFSVGLRASDGVNKFWIGGQFQMQATNDTQPLLDICKELIEKRWTNEVISHVHITALDPEPLGGQMDMFFSPTKEDARREHENQVIDAINDKYGEFAVCSAPLVNRTKMPNVISPAWKPLTVRDYAMV